MANIKKISAQSAFVVMIIFLLIPYFPMIFYKFYMSSIIEVVLSILCYIIAILLCIVYCFIVDSRRNKIIAIIIILAAPLLFFIAGTEANKIGERIFLNKNEEKLNKLVVEVKKHEKIRYFYIYKEYSAFIKRDTINNPSINEDDYTDLKIKLEEIKATSYSIPLDGTVYFVLDGFIGDDEGIAYSTIENPSSKPGIWRHIKDNWYYYLD